MVGVPLARSEREPAGARAGAQLWAVGLPAAALGCFLDDIAALPGRQRPHGAGEALPARQSRYNPRRSSGPRAVCRRGRHGILAAWGIPAEDGQTVVQRGQVLMLVALAAANGQELVGHGS